jgi:hypothetical protein
MHTNWNHFEARDDLHAGRIDIDHLIHAIDSATDDDCDFELGEPWQGDPAALDDDPE